MMDENKDDKIRSLFDGYAEGLEPTPRLANKAREKLHASRNKKRVGIIVGTSIAGAATLAAIGVFAIGVLPGILFGGSNAGDNAPSNEAEACLGYAVTDVRAVTCDYELADNAFGLSELKTELEVFSENYYACYLKDDGEFVYIKGVFGVATEYGTTEICVVAEKLGYRRDDLGADFARLIRAGGGDVDYNKTVGEYVTRAYVADRRAHYYVTARGGSDIAYRIADTVTSCLPRNG